MGVNDAVEACVVFGAAIVGVAVGFVSPVHARPWVTMFSLSVFTYLGVWMIGLLSERRHCRPGEKASVPRSAKYALIPCVPLTVFWIIMAALIYKCVLCPDADGDCDCSGFSKIFLLPVTILRLPDAAVSIGMVFPAGILVAFLLTWLAYAIMNRHRHGCTADEHYLVQAPPPPN